MNHLKVEKQDMLPFMLKIMHMLVCIYTQTIPERIHKNLLTMVAPGKQNERLRNRVKEKTFIV